MPEKKAPDGAKTFTQDQFEVELDKRVKREREKYSDYDELKAKAAKVDEAEAATKSETDKINERLAAAEERAEKAEQRSLRLSVATAKGLTTKQADRLKGTTQEELEADADESIADGTFKPATADTDDTKGKETAGKQPPAGKPVEALSGGGDPTEEPEETDPRKLAAMVPRR